MNQLEEKLKTMNLNNLVEAYKEIEEWNKTGVLNDGITRKLWNECKGDVTQLHLIPMYVYKEISTRYISETLKIDI